MAAASIGQVYRAQAARRPRRGREGPVPGRRARPCARTSRTSGCSCGWRSGSPPGMDAKAMTAEIRERLTDELDYEHEAQAQRAFARAWREPPVRRRPGRGHLPLPRACAGDRVGGRARVRGGQGPARRRARPLRRDRLPLLLRLAVPQRPLLGRPPPGQLQADGGRPRGVPRLRDDQAAEREYMDAEIEAIRFGMEGDAEGLHAAAGARWASSTPPIPGSRRMPCSRTSAT